MRKMTRLSRKWESCQVNMSNGSIKRRKQEDQNNFFSKKYLQFQMWKNFIHLSETQTLRRINSKESIDIIKILKAKNKEKCESSKRKNDITYKGNLNKINNRFHQKTIAARGSGITKIQSVQRKRQSKFFIQHSCFSKIQAK